MSNEIKKTFHITTFGCQMNEHDSEIMAGMLIKAGYEPVSEKKEAGIVIMNTCSIRENADKRFFGTLGQLKRRKENGEKFIMCVCGCMPQQQHIIDTIKAKYPWVDLIFGTHNIHEFPRLLENCINEQRKIIDIWPDGGEVVEGLPCKRLYKHKSYVNIMYGCNNFCTYCIVPYTRGRERSRRPEEIVSEVKELARDGVKEIMLLGQNVNSYRGVSTNAEKTTTFAELICMLDKVEGIERIRFMTSHPKDLSPELIEAFGTCKHLCHQIHLPVQAGSSKVLKRMNRHYDREKYLDLIARLRKAVPDICITTDIIVGFPGETEEDFEDTLSLCREVGYDSAFTFLYSVRKGTPAAGFEDQVPEATKHERFNRLVDVINEGSAKRNATYVGRKVDVLIECEAKRERGDGLDRPGPGQVTLSGRTDGFKLVNLAGPKELIGQIVPGEIISSNTFSLVGRLEK